ncbi:MAG: glutaredoxin family protein [Deltaproteobacteria bacterium]|nr:glutaredoxin family protein [Deltaproteobacteria bacterium]
MGEATEDLIKRTALALALLMLAGILCLALFPTSPLSTFLVQKIKQPPPYHFADDPGEGFTAFYPVRGRDKALRYVTQLAEVPAKQRDTVGKLVLAREQDPAELELPPQVVLYSASWCGFCRRTTVLLDELGVPFLHKDIERSDAMSDELLAIAGNMSIPFLIINGTEVTGYDPDQISALINP